MSPHSLGRHLAVETADEITTVHFRGPKDVALHEDDAHEVADRLLELADTLAERTLVVNFARVSYLTSTLLGKFMALHKRMQAAEGSLVLCDLRPEVYELFKITRLHTVLDVRPQRRPAEDGTLGQPATGS